jgi:hypothetical protein
MRPTLHHGCAIDGCANPHEANGLCETHNTRASQGQRIRHGLAACGYLSLPQLAIIDALFLIGPMQSALGHWVIRGATTSIDALVRRGLAEIKKPRPRSRELRLTIAGADLAMRMHGCPLPVWRRSA